MDNVLTANSPESFYSGLNNKLDNSFEIINEYTKQMPKFREKLAKNKTQISFFMNPSIGAKIEHLSFKSNETKAKKEEDLKQIERELKHFDEWKVLQWAKGKQTN